MADYQHFFDYVTMEETAASSVALTTNETWDSEADDNGTVSNWTDGTPFPIYRHSTTTTIVYCLGYLIVFVLGLIGNCLVVAVVFRCPRMRSVTNFFIVNLAIADILVILFCLPATLLSNIFVPWVLGGAMCKMVTYVQGVSVVASVDSLVAVSLDRFLAICFPMKFQITTRRARIILLVIWILALTTSIPWSMYFQLESLFPSHPEVQLCVEKWPSAYEEHVYFIVANVIFCYLLPLFLILLCYVMIWIRVWSRSIPTENNDAHMERLQQRSKVKVIKMLVVVVVVFSLSWLPLYLIFTRIKLGGEISQWEDLVLSIATPIAQWLGASNSCINPILYAYFNQKYRRAFAAIIKSRSCCSSIRLEDDRSLYRSVMDNHRTGTQRCQRQVSTVSHIDGATQVFRNSKHMANSSTHRGVTSHEIPLTVIDRSMI